MKPTVPIASDLQIEQIEVRTLEPHPDNPRAHPKEQVRRIAESIKAFGFRMPVVIDADGRLICGHARVEACRLLGMDRVPAVRVTDLSDAQVRGLMIADNRLTEISNWDDTLLAQNLKTLSDLDLDFDIETIGFDYGEIEQRILGWRVTSIPTESTRKGSCRTRGRSRRSPARVTSGSSARATTPIV